MKFSKKLIFIDNKSLIIKTFYILHILAAGILKPLEHSASLGLSAPFGRSASGSIGDYSSFNTF